VANRLDEAFNWLVLILSTIAGALSQFPEFYPLTSPRVELALVRLLVFPVVILVFLWLWGLLARKSEFQVVIKSYSWIFASIILMADLILLLLGTVIPRGYFGGPPSLLGNIMSAILITSPLYLSLLFCISVVRPLMREIYKDSKFLYSLPKQALLFIAAVLLYLLAVGLVESILFGEGVL